MIRTVPTVTAARRAIKARRAEIKPETKEIIRPRIRTAAERLPARIDLSVRFAARLTARPSAESMLGIMSVALRGISRSAHVVPRPLFPNMISISVVFADRLKSFNTNYQKTRIRTLL